MLLPANRQNNNNERTKTPKRKRVSLLPFVLPLLKRCHRNALPSSCSVQTRLLLFFFSFQLLSVGRFFFFLKPLKKAPSRVMERVESFTESCVPLRKKTKNERKSSSFLIAKQQQQQQQQQQHHHATEEEDDKDDEGTNTTSSTTTTGRNEETQNAIEDASSS